MANRSVHFCLVLLFAGTLRAAVPRVANSNTLVVTTSTEHPEFGCTLRNAIENHNARSNKYFKCGAGSGNDTINLDQVEFPILTRGPLPTIKNTLTIERTSGTCAELRGDAYLTIADGAKLTLSGVGMSAGGAKSRAVIDNFYSTLIITPGKASQACKFTNNRKEPPERGGIVFNESLGFVPARAFIGGADFENSSARSKGGAIYVGSRSIVRIADDLGEQNSLFRSNVAPRGGAIYVDKDGELDIASNNFELSENQANNAGGAIYNNGGRVTIQRSAKKPEPPLQRILIRNNNAPDGSAIFNDEKGSVSINGVEIRANFSNGRGSVYLGPKSTFSFLGGSCSGNTFQVGGCLYSEGGTVTLNHVTCNGNSARDGGCVRTDGKGGMLEVIGSKIARNNATKGSRGGGLLVENTALTITNSEIVGNSAGAFGDGGIGSGVASSASPAIAIPQPKSS